MRQDDFLFGYDILSLIRMTFGLQERHNDMELICVKINKCTEEQTKVVTNKVVYKGHLAPKISQSITIAATLSLFNIKPPKT